MANDVKFIRKNGHVIPIRGGTSVPATRGAKAPAKPTADGSVRSTREKVANVATKAGWFAAGAAFPTMTMGRILSNPNVTKGVAAAVTGANIVRGSGIAALTLGTTAALAGSVVRAKEVLKRTSYDPTKHGSNSRQAQAFNREDYKYRLGDSAALLGGYVGAGFAWTAAVKNSGTIKRGVEGLRDKLRYARAKNVGPEPTIWGTMRRQPSPTKHIKFNTPLLTGKVY